MQQLCDNSAVATDLRTPQPIDNPSTRDVRRSGDHGKNSLDGTSGGRGGMKTGEKGSRSPYPQKEGEVGERDTYLDFVAGDESSSSAEWDSGEGDRDIYLDLVGSLEEFDEVGEQETYLDLFGEVGEQETYLDLVGEVGEQETYLDLDLVGVTDLLPISYPDFSGEVGEQETYLDLISTADSFPLSSPFTQGEIGEDVLYLITSSGEQVHVDSSVEAEGGVVRLFKNFEEKFILESCSTDHNEAITEFAPEINAELIRLKGLK
ncbi:hypothetical protein TREMEDRAFT_61418 [Tremella mesenterica DSM 1558]|uniref:uncharacterized protein n=1 Tax=Tremella mesenterica (strain ATCC 24925 / CBS 8224 / DSM 1558 / NBRC 9311 / NRRL Y-6157 / RJB 2259-6 / UBC 559-6) TaxID=578456 RepID=UPI0003F49D04|nr:uncharacterized protein TREMEDRAFT_61418 [Tremella mesenterica DSM 1558]EIW70906.1 hypothetical protein TREMEDRAFT_61418 [Tremella mesenterica DSM 1558]